MSRTLSGLFDTIQAPLVAIDAHLSILSANTYFCEQTGWKEKEVKGKNFFDTLIKGQISKASVKRVAQKKVNRYSTPAQIITKTGTLLKAKVQFYSLGESF